MPIRPIDMQVLMPKSQNVSKINQDMANKSENIIQQSLNKNKKIEEKKLKKVNTTDKKENPLVKTNDRNGRIYSKGKGNKDKGSDKNGSSKIDIRI
ncbi:hypothetical protein [Wukongibacter sp. M2B1]|uniref:hypothetical protein n=1 Tax=Wukongibacter sp. M2B1 TaxID=3088895 RepID=UPI003D79AB74